MIDFKKIEEFSKDIDNHLKKLDSFIVVLKEIKESIDSLKSYQEQTYLFEINKVKKDIELLNESLEKYGLYRINEQERQINEIKNLMNENAWPVAVESELICDNEEKINIRSNQIIDFFISENLKDKKFLDFGCGEGHIVKLAIEKGAKFSLGFDIDIKNFKFNKNDVTDDFELVKKNAPYDVVLINDVLDHIKKIDPIEALKNIANILSDEGRIYLKTHPWSSRHGGHLYTQKNNAFLHLIMNESEIMRCFGIETEHNIKVLNSIETYRNWIQKTGLEIKSEIITTSEVEDFFIENSVIKDRICNCFNKQTITKNELEVDFVEYILELPKNYSEIRAI
jgi:2-polyprenyl-3-methyl-5-hydroxy-6-metoxy-1,4-benzoquinol methylase